MTITLRSLPVTFRALFSSFLIMVGTGYLMALSLMFLLDIRPHQEAGLSLIEDISIAYHGNRDATRLEAALMGPMAVMLPTGERAQILAWVHEGAKVPAFAQVEPIFKSRCLACHSPEVNANLPPLTSVENIQKLVQPDNGPGIVQLARVSHIHLFGISIIFLLTGAIFALSETPVWLRVSLVVLPYLSIILDIGSWWATKYFDPLFAWIVIGGGGLMGVALAAQILIPLWQMWIGPLVGLFAPKRVQPEMPHHGPA